MTAYKTTAADRRTADDEQAERVLMCSAHGCPNRWSVDGPNGRCCSAHAWEPSHRWPAITEAQQRAAEHRAFERTQRKAWPEALQRVRAPTAEERAATSKALAIGGSKARGVQWAKRLLVREERGDSLTMAQREMWRDALMVPRSMLAAQARELLMERKAA